MKPKNVLVFPCGSEIGLEVNRALAHSKHFKLFGANSVNDHGKFVYEYYIPDIPFVDSPNFIREINKVLQQYKINFIIPTHDSVVLKLSENQEILKAVVVTSPPETCKICRSKLETYKVFEDVIPVPKIYKRGDKIKYPVFLKPDVGQGTKGTHKVEKLADVEFYLNEDPSLLILEYLPGKEYTVDCFTNSEGKLLFSEGRERRRINNGISVNTMRVENPKFRELAKAINEKISLQGAWFYQVKEREDGELVLMEIAPRIAGTMGLFRVMGVNFVQLSLFDKMGLTVEVLLNDIDIELDRALFARFSIKKDYNFVYIDFDDTIIVDGLVNVDVLKFLYQSRNLGKKIIILTRHERDIKKSLLEFAISLDLFDDIIFVEKNGSKSDYILHKDSIFIDDSFAERQEVNESLGIPVFGLDALEGLMVYRL